MHPAVIVNPISKVATHFKFVSSIRAADAGCAETTLSLDPPERCHANFLPCNRPSQC